MASENKSGFPRLNSNRHSKGMLLNFRRVYRQGLTQITCFPRIIGLNTRADYSKL